LCPPAGVPHGQKEILGSHTPPPSPATAERPLRTGAAVCMIRGDYLHRKLSVPLDPHSPFRILAVIAGA